MGKENAQGEDRKERREREESAFERCFQLLDKGLCFVKTRREKAQQWKQEKKGAQNLPCLLSDSEVEGMHLKALGLLPKNHCTLQKN